MYRNWIGFIVGIGVILAFILGLYIRSVMTRSLYEMVLTLLCTLSLISAGFAMAEAFVNYVYYEGTNRRISTVFSHPNYFGTVVATVIIICAYKILTSQENKWFFFSVAVFNVVSMYLCKSMFAFVEVFIGITILLLILKRYRLLTVWLSIAVIGALMIIFLDFNLIPRLHDINVTVGLRQKIWQQALEEIKKTPFFGHGFMSFLYLIDASYRNRMIPHSHNIYLDMILNFGIVGSILLVWYFIRYYLSVLTSCFKKNNVMVASLILAVSGAALVHGVTDLTLLWIQTLPLFLLILAGQGSEESIEKYAHGIDLM